MFLEMAWQAEILQGWDERNSKRGGGNAETAKLCALFIFPFPPAIYCINVLADAQG